MEIGGHWSEELNLTWKRFHLGWFYFLLNCWIVFLLLVCEKIPVPDVFIYSYSFFLFFVFIPNITAICKNKIPPSSELEMISKELENSHLISFSVNLSSESYLQISSKIVIYCLVETHNHVYNILSLLMFDQVFLSFQFSYVVRYFTWQLEFVLFIL